MRTRFPEDKQRALLSNALHLGNKQQRMKALAAVSSEITSRMQLATKLGQSYSGDRDLYTALGYPLTLTFSRLWGRYKRQDIAKRIVNAYPDATWRGKPEILENEDSDETEFEKAVKILIRKTRLYHYFNRVDKLSRVGNYAVLLLGLDDGRSFNLEVGKASQLLYVQTYKQNDAQIKEYDQDPKSERFGLPSMYQINMQVGSDQGNGISKTALVHWSRVIHVADGLIDNEIIGTSALEAVYNRLQDIELISGGSAEMFWRGAFPGYAFKLDEDASLDGDLDDLEDEIDKYIHNLSRHMKLQNMSIDTLSPQIASPKDHFALEIDLISCETGIPQRILLGSERGELASTQDDDNWNARVEERRIDQAEPSILRATIDRLIKIGVLPEPATSEVEGEYDYMVNWPPMQTKDPEKYSEIAERLTKAMSLYVEKGVDELVPEKQYLMDFIGLSEEQAEAYVEDRMQIREEEEEDARMAQEAIEEEEEGQQ